jgi:hypothetical protein
MVLKPKSQSKQVQGTLGAVVRVVRNVKEQVSNVIMLSHGRYIEGGNSWAVTSTRFFIQSYPKQSLVSDPLHKTIYVLTSFPSEHMRTSAGCFWWSVQQQLAFWAACQSRGENNLKGRTHKKAAAVLRIAATRPCVGGFLGSGLGSPFVSTHRQWSR